MLNLWTTSRRLSLDYSTFCVTVLSVLFLGVGKDIQFHYMSFFFFFDSCDVQSFSIQPFQSCTQAHVESLLHIKAFEKNASSTDTFRIIQMSLFWVRERSTSCSPLSSNFSENSPLCPAVYDNKRESERVKRHWSMFRNFLIPWLIGTSGILPNVFGKGNQKWRITDRGFT